MELRILGPFEVCDDSGQPVKLPAGRERALLAVLLLQRGGVVSTDALVDALWGEQPPTHGREGPPGVRLAPAAPPRRVGRERHPRDPAARLRCFASTTTASTPVGSRRSRRAAGASSTTTPPRRVATFEEALALWRGPALGEFAFAEFAQREIHRLEELRLETVEGRIEALLRLGRHGAVVAELEALVDEHPASRATARPADARPLPLRPPGRGARGLPRAGRRFSPTSSGSSRERSSQRLERAILAQDPVARGARARAWPRAWWSPRTSGSVGAAAATPACRSQ